MPLFPHQTKDKMITKYWLRFDGLNIASRITTTPALVKMAKEDGFTKVTREEFNKTIELVKEIVKY